MLSLNYCKERVLLHQRIRCLRICNKIYRCIQTLCFSLRNSFRKKSWFFSRFPKIKTTVPQNPSRRQFMNSRYHIADLTIMLGIIWKAQSHMEAFQIGISRELQVVLHDFLAFFPGPRWSKLQFSHITSYPIQGAQRKLFYIHPWSQMKGNRCEKHLKFQN